MVHQKPIPLIHTSTLYLCGFLLFLEWLYPVKEVTDTHNLTVFIIYALFCFTISMLRPKWWISSSAKGLGFVLILDALFLKETMLSRSWFSTIVSEFSFNFNVLISADWFDLTAFFRTLLFLLIIWIMSYLIHYWFVMMRRIFLFVFFTFLYLAVLDTFTLYDGKMAIIRTFAISFISLGMAHFFKLIERENISFSWMKKSYKWALPLVMVVLFSSIIGYTTPFFTPQWPDPVPYIKSATSSGPGSGGTGVRKVGYGENDSYLGGSFIQDHTPIFQVVSSSEQYWRIETKDVYTGRGWETSEDSQYEEQVEGVISLPTFSEHVETEEYKAMVRFESGNALNRLVYPYGISEVEAAEGVQFFLDRSSDAIQPQLSGETILLDRYTMTYNEPLFSIEALRESGENDPEEIKEHYTKLPSIPSRINELAVEITASFDNRYDKVRAVEQYFGRNDFVYQTEDVPYPEEGQDYVDQFLFETQAGYCDNYSTSMAVLLRTLGIPARWVKGFTGGEVIGTSVSGGNGIQNVYQVTNSNAHSWVEVYFPEIGWVPFEPTQGFDNLTDIRSTAIHDETELETEELAEETEEEAVDVEQDMLHPDEFEQSEMNDTMNQQENNGNMSFIMIAILIIFVIVIFVLVKTRHRWITWFIYLKFKNKHNQKAFEQAYLHLLKLLGHYTWARKPEQTLREYAKQIDERYETNKMGQLTYYYEQMLYNNVEKDVNMNDLVNIWKELVRRIRN